MKISNILWKHGQSLLRNEISIFECVQLNKKNMKTLTETLNEATMNRRGMTNKIYKAVEKLTSKLYSDEHWQGVSDVKEAITKLGFEVNISVKDGGYRTSKDGNSNWKEYDLEIIFDNITLHGTLNCSAAGSVKDPFDRYDMSLVLW